MREGSVYLVEAAPVMRAVTFPEPRGNLLRMPIMRIPVLLVAAAALACAADVKDFSKTVPLDAQGRFSLDTYKGSIHIAVWDQPRAEIQARIEADPGWRAMPVDDVEIRVDGLSSDVHVKTDYHRHFEDGNLPLVHYTIHIPRTASLRVKDYKSDSEITGVEGEIEFDTYKGTAHIDGIQSALTLETYKGNVRAIFTRFAAASRMNTYKGSIDVSLPRASAFDLSSNTHRGGFDCDFPRTIHATRDLGNVSGAVNGGGPLLRVSSYRGNIRLRSI